MKSRLTDFFNTVTSSLDAYLITNPVDKYYLTGYSSGEDGILVMTRDKSLYFADSRYTLEVSTIEGLEVVELPRGEGLSFVRDYLVGMGVKSLGYSGRGLTHVDYTSLLDDALNLIDIGSELDNLRIIKDNIEIDAMRKAASIADRALANALKGIHAGITEKELEHRLHVELVSLGSEGLSFPTIVAFGDNTSKPHAHPTDRRLSRGDLITIDFGAVVDGYRSDMTRTFFYENADEDMRDIYDILLKAQCSAVKAVREGVTVGELDAIVRENLRANGGLDAYFTHSLGHGVGLQIHEPPYIRIGSDMVLEAGMIVTIEPGVYIEGKGGIRIEDMLLVKKNGYELLSQYKKDLIILK